MLKYQKLTLIIVFQFWILLGFSQKSSDSTLIPIYEASDFICIGKVTGLNDIKISKNEEKKIIADISVIEIYKGRRWNKVMIVADTNSIDINKEYLFYGVWGKARNKKGKQVKAGYFNLLHSIESDNDHALPEVKQLVKIIKQKPFGRIKSPRAKIVLRKCGCSDERL